MFEDGRPLSHLRNLPPAAAALEHDPEKHALGLDPGVETGFRDHAQTKDESALSIPWKATRSKQTFVGRPTNVCLDFFVLAEFLSQNRWPPPGQARGHAFGKLCLVSRGHGLHAISSVDVPAELNGSVRCGPCRYINPEQWNTLL